MKLTDNINTYPLRLFWGQLKARLGLIKVRGWEDRPYSEKSSQITILSTTHSGILDNAYRKVSKTFGWKGRQSNSLQTWR